MITMRTQGSKQGLVSMCEYLKKHIDISKLTMIEIGAFYGDSTMIFAEYFNGVITIDPWESNIGDISNSMDMEEVHQDFLKNIEGYNNISYIRDYSHNVADRFDKIDCIYIDGMHTYESVKKDLEDWADKCKYFISGHDYAKKFPGVVQAVNELKNPDALFKDWSWVIKGEQWQ